MLECLRLLKQEEKDLRLGPGLEIGRSGLGLPPLGEVELGDFLPLVIPLLRLLRLDRHHAALGPLLGDLDHLLGVLDLRLGALL